MDEVRTAGDFSLTLYTLLEIDIPLAFDICNKKY